MLSPLEGDEAQPVIGPEELPDASAQADDEVLCEECNPDEDTEARWIKAPVRSDFSDVTWRYIVARVAIPSYWMRIVGTWAPIWQRVTRR